MEGQRWEEQGVEEQQVEDWVAKEVVETGS